MPDWLEVPSTRRQELSRIVVQLNEILKSEERARRRSHAHPMESTLVLPAVWPSTSVLLETSSASASTLRARRMEDPGSAMTSKSPEAYQACHPLTTSFTKPDPIGKPPMCTERSPIQHRCGSQRVPPPHQQYLSREQTVWKKFRSN